MKPPITPAGTRERLLDAAIGLLRRSGLSGAGINGIVRASGAPKGSVYHFFPEGKQQIAREALSQYSLRVVAFIDGAMAGRGRPADRVKALFDAFAKRIEHAEFRQSCAAGTVCLDLDDDVEDLRDVVAGALAQYQAAIAERLPFRDRNRAASFAGLLLSAIEGAYIRCRADRSSEPFREAGAWLAELAAREPIAKGRLARRSRAATPRRPPKGRVLKLLSR